MLASIERARGHIDYAEALEKKFGDTSKYYHGCTGELDLGGVERRRRALTVNPDDYVLRFAVSLDLDKAGNSAQAKATYLEAYRSMAKQFGSITSTDTWIDSTKYDLDAETMLSHSAAPTNRPWANQLLLADLFASHKRPAQALELYLKVVRSNPEITAAWLGLDRLRTQIELPSDLDEAVESHRVELLPTNWWWPAPQLRHYAALWTKAESVLRFVISVPTPILTLKASQTAIRDRENTDSSRRYAAPPLPGSVIETDKTLSSLGTLISTLGPGGRP